MQICNTFLYLHFMQICNTFQISNRHRNNVDFDIYKF